MEFLEIKLLERNHFVFEPNPSMQVFHSVLGDYLVHFKGIISNADVVQLMTPASIRQEHPIATLVSCSMDYNPTFVTMQKIANSMAKVSGSFVAAWESKKSDRIIVAIRNLPLVLKADKLCMDRKAKPQNIVYMFGPGMKGIDVVDVAIPAKAERKLYVVESLSRDWSSAYGYNPKLDTRISYTQLNYKFVKTPDSISGYADLVVHACRFAEELDQDDLASIHMGLSPLDMDLLEANTLTRLTYIASNRRFTLELPKYDEAIRNRVISAS